MNSSTFSDLSPLQRAHGNDQEPSSSHFSLKKVLPIKKNDAEMLTRQDIQFDLLDAIFSDTTRVFTDQTSGNATKKLTFSELYIGALYQSSKCSKVLKDKMNDTPAFANELGKISLLANVGRVNTTMAFFPEMRTALRTYHPVPSLQKTDGNLQDAPRIKNCLKAALLPSELKRTPPSSLAQVLEKLRLGTRPPTSIVNLIFIMANQTTVKASRSLYSLSQSNKSRWCQLLARTHFDPPLDFLDLFMPVNIPSPQRARAFLWLVYHYLEDPTSSSQTAFSTNPFADDYSRANPGKVPWLPRLTSEDMRRRGENVDPEEEVEWGNRMCAQRTSFLQRLITTSEAEKRNKSVFNSAQVLELAPRRPRAPRQVYKGDNKEGGFRHYAPQQPHGYGSFSSVSRNSPHPATSPEVVSDRLQPRHKTMFEHAFHIVSTTDPLADSDEEYDEHVKFEYGRRLRVLNRLRGKSPTPPPRRGPSERRDLVRNRWDPYPKSRRRSKAH